MLWFAIYRNAITLFKDQLGREKSANKTSFHVLKLRSKRFLNFG